MYICLIEWLQYVHVYIYCIEVILKRKFCTNPAQENLKIGCRDLTKIWCVRQYNVNNHTITLAMTTVQQQ